MLILSAVKSYYLILHAFVSHPLSLQSFSVTLLHFVQPFYFAGYLYISLGVAQAANLFSKNAHTNLAAPQSVIVP